MLELLLIPAIFIVSLILIIYNFEVAITLLLALSLLLHKEVFSIYRWDVLPVRIFMLAILTYSLGLTIRFLFKNPDVNVIKNKLRKLFSEPFIILFSLLWVVRGISIAFTKNLEYSLFLYGFFTTIFALGILLYTRLKGESQKILNFVRKYIWFIFAAALFGFVQIMVYAKYDLVIGAMWPIPGNIPRVGSTFWDVNQFAGLIAVLSPVLGVFILIDKGAKKKALNIFAFAILLVILFLTNSRTAWMASFFAFLSFSATYIFRKFRFKGIAYLVGALILITLPLINEYNDKESPFRAKIKNYFHYRIDSFESHILLIRGAFEIFEERPILGGGYGGFFEHFSKTDISTVYFGRDPAGLNTRVPAHSVWGEALSETGIIGFSIYLFMITVILTTLFYGALTLKDTSQMLLTNAMGSAIFGLMIAGIFYSYKTEFFWIILILYFLYGVSVLVDKYNFERIIKSYARSNKFFVFTIALLGFVLIFSKLGVNHLIPWDEAIYAKIAKNMVVSGDYLIQRWISIDAWFEKPPLYMWFMAISMRLFGIGEFAARFPSALSGFLTLFVTYFFGKKLYSKTAGFLAAFTLLTTFQFLYYSRSAMLDVTATLFITLSLYTYYLAKENLRVKYWIISGVFTGLAVMTKGVVGFLPFLVISFYELYLVLIVDQKITKQVIKKYFYMFGFSALVFLPWHLIMFAKFGVPFLSNYIGYHVVARATSAIEDKGRPFLWYITVLKVSMRLWFVALLGALPITFLRAVLKKHKKDAFLVVYALSMFLFFSVAKSKLVWYIIPLYPVLAIIVGDLLARLVYFVSGKSSVLKLILVYALVSLGLVYLLYNKELVYPSDLTGKQATLVKEKDKEFGAETTLYADRIELPLLEFYSDGPNVGVDYGPLKEELVLAKINGTQLVFITKESRFSDFKEIYPELVQEERIDEWVLGYLPSSEEQKKILEREQQ